MNQQLNIKKLDKENIKVKTSDTQKRASKRYYAKNKIKIQKQRKEKQNQNQNQKEPLILNGKVYKSSLSQLKRNKIYYKKNKHKLLKTKENNKKYLKKKKTELLKLLNNHILENLELFNVDYVYNENTINKLKNVLIPNKN
jgi:hypothetical protein